MEQARQQGTESRKVESEENHAKRKREDDEDEDVDDWHQLSNHTMLGELDVNQGDWRSDWGAGRGRGRGDGAHGAVGGWK